MGEGTGVRFRPDTILPCTPNRTALGRGSRVWARICWSALSAPAGWARSGAPGTSGSGGRWRARGERRRRPGAVKQIRPDRLDQPGARARLRHEAAAGARLNPPAIVHIYDILQAGEVEWIVMELVEGRTLAEILTGGPLALSQAVRLGREIAKGLAKAHSEGIVHRDLKTLNVMVPPSGHAKILDFGIAKLSSAES